MQHIFHLPGDYSFERAGHKGKIFDTKKLGNELEFEIIETERGHDAKIMEKECIFAYYILEGKGFFEIDGKKEECCQGELVMVPKGTPFQYFGKLKMLLVSTPWWFPEQEESL
jgi:mannose-6-phosphate isomerase-like protein (cupin superfamily)